MTKPLRALAGICAVALSALMLVQQAGPAQAAAYAPPADGSTLAPAGDGATVTATDGPFKGLALTVSQTRNLIDQVVTVTWKGATPTAPVTGRFGKNYLQVMQCWADPGAAGPRREQCQYGARVGDGRGGAYVPTRQVNYGELVDPQETYTQQAGSKDNVFVPFESVTGKVSTGSRSEFFDGSTTNELAFARTREDGSGTELFEVQTSTEAPGLGCGARDSKANGQVRSCFLVVVPRGGTEVDGTSRAGTGAKELQSSPLSETNWQHRVVVPLQFEPLGNTCPQTSERRTVGHELVSELITRWQPTLCADGGATYGYSQVTDAFAANQLAKDDPGLTFSSRAADPSSLPSPAIYAPVALQGLSISFLVERVPVPSAPEAEQLRGGTAVSELKLTPRLVAKLLTQSYANAVPDRDPAVAKNPELLTRDPDFLRLNPEFGVLNYTQLSDIVVPVGQSDAVAQLWTWINADPEARAWLNGAADPDGMVVNPAYKGIVLPVPEFPKADPYCRKYIDDRLPLCALERRPYAADLGDAGRSAARGDNLARQFWDPLAFPPAWKRSEPLPNGSRAVLAVTDTATAFRYGLTTASLRNAAGVFVKPTDASLLAGLAAAKPGAVPQVLVPDPTAKDPAVYPLTTLSYASTVPASLTAKAGQEYAALLDYAAGPGQTPGVAPGTLPGGYVPLPQTLRDQTTATAKLLRTSAGVAAPSKAPETAPPAPPSSTSGSSGLFDGPSAANSFGSGGTFGGGTFGGGTSGGATFRGGTSGVPPGLSSPVVPPLAIPQSPELAPPAGTTTPTVTLTSAGPTPGAAVGARRFWVPAVLLLGVLAGLLAPALTRIRPGSTPGSA